MAKFADYVKVQEAGINEEIVDANAQQTARQEDATQAVDWEKRYGELEKLNSRQAQTLGDYRKTIDDFITSPTTSEANPSTEPPLPITTDDLYDDPNAAVLRAVESHPAIQEARDMKAAFESNQRQSDLDAFALRHEDYQEIVASPEFQNWVADNPTRQDLFQRGNQYDFSAADAVFSLYKAEQGLAQNNNAQEIAQAELVSGTSEFSQEPPTYSRSEYINKLMRSKQGDLEAEDWVKTHAANYRMALTSGNVRD